MTRKRICGYCGKPLEGAGYPGIKEKETCYCSPECRKKHEAALVKIRKNLKWFAAGIAASILLVLHSAFAGAAAGGEETPLSGGIGMSLLGITLLLFPYCTPETYAMFGYVRTTRLGRGMGILVILFGLWMLWKAF